MRSENIVGFIRVSLGCHRMRGEGCNAMVGGSYQDNLENCLIILVAR
jgi:hypothetical protein